MARTDGQAHAILQPGDRIAIVAGSGQLPVDLAEAPARARASLRFVVMVEGEAEPELVCFDHETISARGFPDFVPLLQRRKVTHAVFAGGISRRPRLRDLKLTCAFLRLHSAGARRRWRRGDDGLLRAIAGLVESNGHQGRRRA